MNTEDSLPFELCKRAKEAGYPQDLEPGYVGVFDAWHPNGLEYGASSQFEDYKIEGLVARIYPYELQRWLRQKEGVIMYVVPCDISSSGGWAYNVRVWSKGKLLVNKEQQCSSVSLKFEEAMIEGLEHSLKLLGK